MELPFPNAIPVVRGYGYRENLHLYTSNVLLGQHRPLHICTCIRCIRKYEITCEMRFLSLLAIIFIIIVLNMSVKLDSGCNLIKYCDNI